MSISAPARFVGPKDAFLRSGNEAAIGLRDNVSEGVS